MTEAAQALDTGTPAPAIEQPGTITTNPGPAIQAPQDWPDDWRTKIAGEDDKELSRLERLSSPQDLWKKYRHMETEYSKRQPRVEYDPEMPEEKLAEWRKQEGIPESPDKYSLEYEDGLVIGENDKEYVDDFLKYAHEKNLPENNVKEAVRWYLENQSKQQEALDQRRAEYKYENLAKLKAEWGGEFQGNIGAVKELFTDHPEVESLLLEAFDSEGLHIGNNEQVVRWAVDLAKKINPAATITLPGGESGLKAGQTRLTELKEIMYTDIARWHKSPELQKEYDDLVSRLPQ